MGVTAPHVQAYDGRPSKRPYTREELDALFEHADNEVERIGRSGRKGWQPAYRDAVMMKIAYGYGLRFNELRHLQTIDFARNPHAREFGAFGVCKVRYGRIRVKAAAGAPTRGPVHSAKQEITEAIKFLVWLHNTYQRTAASCTQSDIDEWLATGPTTRTAIRTFFIVAKRTRLNTKVVVQHRAAHTSPSLTQDQRLAWINELLTGTSESLPYRAAGMLLLLYAQPLVKIATLKLSTIDDHPDGMSILLGQRPTDVPEPFAQPLRDHIAQRPNLRTGAGPASP